MAHASRERRSKGELVAIALRGAWRETPPPLALGANDLRLIAPVLLRSGSAALAWWKATSAGSAPSQIPEEFLNAYKSQLLSAAVHECKVKEVFTALDAAGVDAMLVKGWAIARRYPMSALRPYGDLDLRASGAVRISRQSYESLLLKCGSIYIVGSALWTTKTKLRFLNTRLQFPLAGSLYACRRKRTTCGCFACTCFATGPRVRCGCAMLLWRSSPRRRILIGRVSMVRMPDAGNG